MNTAEFLLNKFPDHYPEPFEVLEIDDVINAHREYIKLCFELAFNRVMSIGLNYYMLGTKLYFPGNYSDAFSKGVVQKKNFWGLIPYKKTKYVYTDFMKEIEKEYAGFSINYRFDRGDKFFSELSDYDSLVEFYITVAKIN